MVRCRHGYMTPCHLCAEEIHRGNEHQKALLAAGAIADSGQQQASLRQRPTEAPPSNALLAADLRARAERLHNIMTQLDRERVDLLLAANRIEAGR